MCSKTALNAGDGGYGSKVKAMNRTAEFIKCLKMLRDVYCEI